MKDNVLEIINGIFAQPKEQRDREVFDIAGEGSFTLRRVHSSWAAEFMLGAFDYYEKRDVAAFQILPDKTRWTIDIPDISAPWSGAKEPIWRWLREPWTYPVSKDATATTNLAALHGRRITEAMRWEADYWELFAGAGPEVSKDDIRVVPIGALVASDSSLMPVLNLPVGAGLWRDAVSEWQPWSKTPAK